MPAAPRLRQVRAVPDEPAWSLEAGALGHERGGVGDRGAAGERVLGGPRPERAAHVDQADRGAGDRAVVSVDERGNPTVAQSWARRFAFRYAQPVEAASFDAGLDEHLVGPERGLEHAREELRGRDHPLSTEPWATSSAPRASITAGMSDAGSPCASVPPSVPR